MRHLLMQFSIDEGGNITNAGGMVVDEISEQVTPLMHEGQYIGITDKQELVAIKKVFAFARAHMAVDHELVQHTEVDAERADKVGT